MLIRDLNINYHQYGKKDGKSIVLLHGWGQNTKMMDPLGKALADDFYITNIDLPGFGQSDEPKTELSIAEYYEIIKELLTNLKINNPIIIGHSFGGKIAIYYAAKAPVQKLILLASPFRATNKKPTFKAKALKTAAKMPGLKPLADKMKNKIGSSDYRNASPIMKKVLVNTIHTDLTKEMKTIKSPTLLIWGTLDADVNIEDGKYAQTIIPNAGLVIYEGRTHYAYLEELERTIRILKEFLKNDKE